MAQSILLYDFKSVLKFQSIFKAIYFCILASLHENELCTGKRALKHVTTVSPQIRCTLVQSDQGLHCVTVYVLWSRYFETTNFRKSKKKKKDL